jgi:taurine dioxygenase
VRVRGSDSAARTPAKPSLIGRGPATVNLPVSSTAPTRPADQPHRSRIAVVPSGQPLAAEIQGVDVRTLTDDEFGSLHRAWLDHLVIVVRRQTLTDEELLAFSRRFGTLEWAPIQETGRRFVEGHPEIYVVSNVMRDGVPIGSLGAGEATWHTDMSYLETPPKASVLYALEVPPEGGNTYFCSMYRAHDALPGPLARRIADLTLKHDATFNSGGYVRQGLAATDDPVRSPGVYHPIVCRHPETGRRLLYLGRRRNAYIAGLTLAESEALLDELWSYATAEEHAWHLEWQVGDLVLWDNRCTMHRRDAFDGNSRRVLHRTQIKGETRPAR